MKKPAFFLFMCFSFLLLSGSNQLHRSVSFHNFFLTGAKQSQAILQQPILQSKNTAVHSTTRSSVVLDLANAIEPEDTDEDDSEASETYPATSHYFQQQCFCTNNTLYLYQKEQLRYRNAVVVATDKYVLHQVFRI